MILHFVNSFVGRTGNIGARTTHVLNTLAEHGELSGCFARGAQNTPPGVHIRTMGWLGHVPRALNGLRIYVLPFFNHRFMDIRLFEHFALRALKRIEQPVRLAHVWDCCPQLIGALQARRIPVVLDVPIAPMAYAQRVLQHAPRDTLFYDPRFAAMELRCFEMADHLVAPSQFVAEELARLGIQESKISVVEFGVEIPAVPTTVKPDKRRGLDFCFLGSVNERKGVRELLSAWSDPAFSDDRLHLCGRVFPELRRAIGAAPVRNVITPGFVRSFDYLANCDVFVFPTWMEGSSKAVYEAMACGLPAIVTRSAGSVVRDGREGFVVEPGDIHALRERMVWCKEHPQEVAELGSAARNRVREFSWQRYGTSLLQLYSRVNSCV